MIRKDLVFHVLGIIIVLLIFPYIFSHDNGPIKNEFGREPFRYEKFDLKNNPEKKIRQFYPEFKVHPAANRQNEIFWTKFFLNFICVLFFYFNTYYLYRKYWLEKKYFNWSLWILLGAWFSIVIPIFLLRGFDFHRPFLMDLQINLFFYSLTILCSTLWCEFNQKKEIEKLKLQAEVQLIKANLNNHFLFNSLNLIYSLTLYKDDNAPKAVLLLSNLLKFVLTETNKVKITLSEELNFISDYIELQKFRLTETINVEFNNHITEVQSKNLEVCPFIFLPFIENAFKFGISTTKVFQIKIYFTYIEPSIIRFYIENQINPTQSSGTKLGLKNVQKLLNLHYWQKHKLNIENDSIFYKIYLTIEL